MKNSIAFPQLLHCSLLEDLPDDAKVSFLDECSLRRYVAPTEILTQGAPVTSLFLIAIGRIEVSYCDGEGNQTLIHMAVPGEVLGEAEALTKNPSAATCTTLPNTTLLCAPAPLVYEHVRSAVFVRNLMAVLYERLIRDNKYRNVNQFYTLDQRLCIYLCQLSSATRPEVKINQSDLANVVGCSRQSINRKLAELRDEGLITMGKGAIKVLARDRLETRVRELL